MRIADLFSTSQAESIASTERSKKQDEEASQPSSWGADTVSISQEARDAQQAAASGKDDKKDDKNEAAEAFRSYMKSKSSASSGSPEEQIKALKEKLKELQGRMAQVASNESMPEGTKTAMLNSIESQVTQIIAQIGELESQLAKEGPEAAA